MSQKTLQELTIKDNFMFGAVMCEEENSKEFLEMLFGVHISKVDVSKEKTIVYHPKYKGVRLDVYIEDENRTRYNIEMQALSHPCLSKRTRYYHSQMDMDMILAGADYEEMSDVLVIFVCDFDPFGKGKYMYTVENRCIEDDSIQIADGSRSVYLSTKGKNEDEVFPELVSFLKYVHADLQESKKDFDDEFVSHLQAAVERVKENRKMGEHYMTLQQCLRDEYKKGKREGIEEGRREVIEEYHKSKVRKKLLKGKSVEEIAEALEEDTTTIQKLIDEIKSEE